jgi:integrase
MATKFDRAMAKKDYFPVQLNDEWMKSWEAGKKLSQLRNHSGDTPRQISNVMLWISLDFQDQGVDSLGGVRDDDWLRLVERYRTGEIRTQNVLKESTIDKRKEGLILMLKAEKKHDILEFVEMWKPMKEEEVIRWWTEEEMEAMNQTALRMLREGEKPERAIAHLLHFIIAPRRSDTALFTWDRIDFRNGMIRFPAHKNRKQCQNKIEPRLVPYILQYRELVSDYPDGDRYLFPKSRAQKSGTDNAKKPYISDKTIATWLADVRDRSTLRDGTRVRPFPTHSYRHSLAMRYLNAGCDYEDVSGVLGDTVATIEKHYAELIFTPAREAAWRKAHTFATKITSEHSAQPALLMREAGYRPSEASRVAVPRIRGMNGVRGMDVGVCRPQTNTSL